MKYFLNIHNLTILIKTSKDCFVYDQTEANQTLQELSDIVATKYGVDPYQIAISQANNGSPISNTTMLISTFFNKDDQIFIKINKPIYIPQNIPKTEEVKTEFFSPITKYTFYELDEWNVRILVELKNIGKVPIENFKSRFLQRSFEIKIHDYNGKNWIFGIGKTLNKLNPEGSRFVVKPDKILITLRKFKKEENWFSIATTRTIGGNDSD